MEILAVPVATPPPLAVYSDFDGTIALEDVTDAILERLAEPEWRIIEEQWLAGEINSRTCMARQIALVRGGWDAIKEVLKEIRLDPAFAEFATWCSNAGIPLWVVSDGLDRVIHHLLWREEIPVSGIWANPLHTSPGDRLFLTASGIPARQECQSGLCKCQVLEMTSLPPTRRIVIGDGRSDFCWVREADIVFAKHHLLEHCRTTGIPCRPFGSFADIQAALEELAASPARTGSRRAVRASHG